MIKLKCLRCGKEWEYSGEIIPTDKYPQYTSCPRCKTSVIIKLEIKNKNKMKEK